MAQPLHGSATTTARLQAAFQASAEPTAVLAQRYGVNPKTVAKWRRRQSVEDLPMGPHERTSSVPSELEEAAVMPAEELPATSVPRGLPLPRDRAPPHEALPPVDRPTGRAGDSQHQSDDGTDVSL
jgi:hypothetical protein